MLALYRAGRQSEALEAYREAHRTLIERDRGRAGARAASACRSRSSPRTRPSTHAPPAARAAAPARGRLAAARRARARAAAGCASAGREAREAGSVWVALVWGPAGIGKTRLVAELAAEVQREGAAVLYAGGRRARRRRARATVAAAGRATRPTLLVLDYADDAPPACSRPPPPLARAPEGRPLLVCVLHHDEQGPPAFAGLLATRPPSAAARPLGRGPPPRSPSSTRRPTASRCRSTTLIAESEGVPLRIHRAAGGWAQAEAAERLAATAGQAADERGELARDSGRSSRAASSTCRSPASGRSLYVVEEPPDPSEPEVCPFRGLAPFDAAHAEYFFGRERLVAELVARLVGSTLLAVVGPSGSGKSSARARRPSAGAGRRGRSRLGALAPGGDAPGRAPAGRALAGRSPGAVPEAGREDAAPWIADALDSARARRAPGALDRSVRGGLRRLSRRGRARRVLRRAGRGRRRPRRARWWSCSRSAATSTARCAEHAELSTLVSANQRPGRADAPRRAAPGDRAARPAGGAAGRAATGLGAGRRRRRRARRPAAALRRPGRALAAARAAAPCATRVYERSGGVSGAVARLAEDAYQRLSEAERAPGPGDPAAPRRRRGAGRGARPPPRLRSTSSSSSATRTPPGPSPCSPRAACSPSTRARSRSPTRRCFASGRACAAGSRRTPRAAAFTST